MIGTHTRPGWRAWLRRRSGLGASPLRRASDRAEAWLRVGLLVLFLASAPALSLGLSHWTWVSMTAQARAQAAREHLVPARLLTGSRHADRYPGTGSGYEWAPASWTAPGEGRRTGTVYARAGARPGSVVWIWTDHAGRQARPPLSRAQIGSRMITVALLAPLGLALLLLTVAGIVHQILDRRRLASWEANWRLVEPRWTRRLR